MGVALDIVRQMFPEVEKVVDARKNVIIDVTKRDVSASKRKVHKECAMAVAAKRSLHVDGAIISLKTAYLIRGKKAIRYMTPDSVSREITAFDRNAGFEVGTYQLQAPSPAYRLGIKRGSGGSHKRDARPMKKRFQHFTVNVRGKLSAK